MLYLVKNQEKFDRFVGRNISFNGYEANLSTEVINMKYASLSEFDILDFNGIEDIITEPEKIILMMYSKQQ